MILGVLELMLVMVIVGGVIVFLVNALTNRPDALAARERAELSGLRGLVGDLKDIAYDHRELDSALATIMIDRIRTYERQQRELGN